MCRSRGDDGSQGAHLHVHAILYELHHRVEQICQEPRDEEGQQHAAQIVGDGEDGHGYAADGCPAHHFVECNLLFVHIIVPLLSCSTRGRAAHTRPVRR